MEVRWFMAEADWEEPEGVEVLEVHPSANPYAVYIRLRAEDWDWLQGDLQACEGPE